MRPQRRDERRTFKKKRDTRLVQYSFGTQRIDMKGLLLSLNNLIISSNAFVLKVPAEEQCAPCYQVRTEFRRPP